eukprot:CAMPEP_0197002028 /NCGR_PEP_ID=MMETSP1380-20130617/6599_1 /TAXON_ID=5936 /ORGANISM="Euplotes crassus, Strain CT5" /LENGTH=134 /DNA_ID=CAMNT_0042419947 /DNA_START=277 /DNA_END=677 /DNA_ORIENTATION=+
MLADLAVNEPYSFKATLDEVMKNNHIASAFLPKPRGDITYKEALKKNLLAFNVPEKEPEIPDLKILRLRNPERDAGTDADYYRLSFREEDEKWLADQKKLQLTLKEMKKHPREVIEDDWDENPELYKHKTWKRT